MRRPAPRPVRLALEQVTRESAPHTVLARVQGVWPAVAGAALAAAAEPVSERGGILTVACRSAAWAHELSLAGPGVVRRLNEALDPGAGGPLKELRSRVGPGPAPPSSGPRGSIP